MFYFLLNVTYVTSDDQISATKKFVLPFGHSSLYLLVTTAKQASKQRTVSMLGVAATWMRRKMAGK